MRNLILVLGDQLDGQSAVFDDFDAEQDTVWMAEVHEEATHVWCHKLRIAFFLSCMRHFRDGLRKKGIDVSYHELQTMKSKDRGNSFGEVLTRSIKDLKPEKLVIVEPGDFRVRESIQQAADAQRVELEVRGDRHFYCSIEEFEEYASTRKGLVLEFFYRYLRKKHDVLMEDGEPIGGQWNFDHDNRESFKKTGPPASVGPKAFKLDATTKSVIELVEKRFADHPGTLDHFNLPTTRRQALAMLKQFVEYGLERFGTFQDAMWEEEHFLFHSRLSAVLNVKLLNPRECVDAAIEAHRQKKAPLNSVEGFVRQIIGWREYVRGIYWLKMPEYIDRNHLEHQQELPSFFWDGDTDMNCVQKSMRNVIDNGYAHHIQRLMVLGNFSQLWGVDPRKFHDWHMAMYLDAIDWVSLPNTVGMSQFADGGVVGTKPYCSSGNYINKMSNYCKGCRYNFKQRIGEDACPFTTLYWDFMDRHYDKLKGNGRLKFAIKNLEKLREKEGEMASIRQRVVSLRDAKTRV